MGTGPIPGGDSAFSCSFVGGGAATVSGGCINCKIGALQNRQLAADTDLTSAATLNLYHPDDLASQEAQATLKVIAQDGVVFPEGSVPGIAMQQPLGSNAIYSIVVTTYLDGSARESQPAGNFAGPSSGDLAYVGFTSPATMTFDAVEVTITETQPSLEEHVYRLIEVCGDGALK
jgi:hypothetical protein